MTYDDWKSTEPPYQGPDAEEDADEPLTCVDDCPDDATETVDMARLSGDERAPKALPLCAACARWTRAYWKRMADEERI